MDALHAKRAKLHRKLTPDEATTVLERACVTVRSEYGLQMRNNAVTPVYSKHQAVARAEGNWISIFLINVCAQVVGEHEKAIVRGAFDAATSVNDLRARACQRGDAEEEEEEDEDGGAGLGVCPEDVDWSRVNTHDDGWSSSSLPTESKDGKELGEGGVSGDVRRRGELGPNRGCHTRTLRVIADRLGLSDRPDWKGL